jgi:predicted Rdx family selenoprotein
VSHVGGGYYLLPPVWVRETREGPSSINHMRSTFVAAAELQKCLGVNATLKQGTGGIFQVAVDGTVVAKRAKGHFPDAAAIVDAVSRVNR